MQSSYVDRTRRLLAMLQAVAAFDHTPQSLSAHLGVSGATMYRMLHDVEGFGASIEWDGSAYRIASYGAISRKALRESSI